VVSAEGPTRRPRRYDQTCLVQRTVCFSTSNFFDKALIARNSLQEALDSLKSTVPPAARLYLPTSQTSGASTKTSSCHNFYKLLASFDKAHTGDSIPYTVPEKRQLSKSQLARYATAAKSDVSQPVTEGAIRHILEEIVTTKDAIYTMWKSCEHDPMSMLVAARALIAGSSHVSHFLDAYLLVLPEQKKLVT
jgi:hypothetical protein